MDDKEWIAGMIITGLIIFFIGFGAGAFIDEHIKTDSLAQVLYKDTTKYLQHRNDNFFNLLKLVKAKDGE